MSLTAVAGASQNPAPLLLSFDVEDQKDISALEALNIKEPATYFITGQFAQRFPEVVRKLAENGTIGSHSFAHPHHTRIKAEAVRDDLAASQQAILAATGHSPVWFRAPYLEYNDEVLEIARDLGFRFDSSELERWLQQKVLTEFPISMNTTGKVLFSDYDILERYGMDSELALNLLKENYRYRSNTGRPFVFLLHPRIIAKQPDILQQFIRYVKSQGGKCLTFDQYFESIIAHRPNIKGARIDVRIKNLDTRKTVQALTQAGIGDVFLMAVDTEGRKYYSQSGSGAEADDMPFNRLHRGLKNVGIRVHAWISVNRNSRLAQQSPKQAMAFKTGKISDQWLAPSHPENRRHLQRTISELLAGFDLDGIHLDHIAFPNLDYDFSEASVRAFLKESGIALDSKNRADQLLVNHYEDWSVWRIDQISQLVMDAADAVSRQGPNSITISAALDYRAVGDYRIMEAIGLDYRLLADHLDMIIPFGFAQPDSFHNQNMEIFINSIRFLIGNKKLLIGVPMSNQPTKEASSENTVVALLGASTQGTQGVVFDVGYESVHTAPYEGSSQINGISVLKTYSRIWDEKVRSSIPYSATTDAAVEPRETDVAPFVFWKRFKHGTWILATVILAVLLTVLGKRYLKTKPMAMTAKQDSGSRVNVQVQDWRAFERAIVKGVINGRLIRDVATLLRQYDPVNVSTYRVAMILDIIESQEQKLGVSTLVDLDVQISGWQVLSMSYLEEAVLLGYVILKDGFAELSTKGRGEIRRIRNNGYDRDYWMFVERRLHESLIVSCPKCHSENVTHWFWPTFKCFHCDREFALADCMDISCRTAKVALNQHKIA